MRGLLIIIALGVALFGCLSSILASNNYQDWGPGFVVFAVGLLVAYALRRGARAAKEERRHRELVEASGRASRNNGESERNRTWYHGGR